jgi:hypothetical protein
MQVTKMPLRGAGWVRACEHTVHYSNSRWTDGGGPAPGDEAAVEATRGGERGQRLRRLRQRLRQRSRPHKGAWGRPQVPSPQMIRGFVTRVTHSHVVMRHGGRRRAGRGRGSDIHQCKAGGGQHTAADSHMGRQHKTADSKDQQQHFLTRVVQSRGSSTGAFWQNRSVPPAAQLLTAV